MKKTIHICQVCKEFIIDEEIIFIIFDKESNSEQVYHKKCVTLKHLEYEVMIDSEIIGYVSDVDIATPYDILDYNTYLEE